MPDSRKSGQRVQSEEQLGASPDPGRSRGNGPGNGPERGPGRRVEPAEPATTVPSSGDTSQASTELYSRNWAFLAPEAQARLNEPVIFAAGVGLASNIVTLAARTGFRRFILADGDRVEPSNLNRQDFTLREVGQNKARATARRLRGIRPDAEVTVLPRRLTARSYLAPLTSADIVINSIDFDERLLFLLNDGAQRMRKPVLQPLNLGWGGAVLTFLPDSPSLAAFLEIEPPSAAAREKVLDVKLRLVQRVVASLPDGLPEYLVPVFDGFQAQSQHQGDAWTVDPQLGVAATLTTALAVSILVALALGEPVRAVPQVAYSDAQVLTRPRAREHVHPGAARSGGIWGARRREP